MQSPAIPSDASVVSQTGSIHWGLTQPAKIISASTAAPSLGNVSVTKTPICSPSLSLSHTHTHLHTLSPTFTPCCAREGCTPSTAATKWESGWVVRGYPRQQKPSGHPTDTLTPPPSSVTPPTQLTHLCLLDRHLTGMPRRRVLQSTAGWWLGEHLDILSSPHLGEEGGRDQKEESISLTNVLQSSWSGYHGYSSTQPRANWERKEVSQYEGGALSGGRKRKSAVICVNTRWPSSSLLEY